MKLRLMKALSEDLYRWQNSNLTKLAQDSTVIKVMIKSYLNPDKFPLGPASD